MRRSEREMQVLYDNREEPESWRQPLRVRGAYMHNEDYVSREVMVKFDVPMSVSPRMQIEMAADGLKLEAEKQGFRLFKVRQNEFTEETRAKMMENVVQGEKRLLSYCLMMETPGRTKIPTYPEQDE